jgi:ABC-type phosphate transport system substrate-binding protein
MRLRLRHGIVAGAITLSMAMVMSPNAMAATTGTGPHWFTGKIQQVRSAGSETTYYLMQKIGNLYNQTSIFGCTLSATDRRTCNTSGDTKDTDILDDYDRTEVMNGAGVGSGGGIDMLCGGPAGNLPVDFARSSRAVKTSDTCNADLVSKPLAKDAIVGLNFPFETPPTGATIGPVAQGWRTGDPLGGPYSGKPVTNLDNTTTVVNRIWCKTDSTRITDWGQLTDPAHVTTDTNGINHPDGNGAPIGAPINIWGVQTSSGTKGGWDAFTGCDSNVNVPQSTTGGINHVIQENNVPQIRNVTNLETTDPVARYNQINQSLYFMSFGVFQSTPYAASNASAMQVNGVDATSLVISSGGIATVRTLYNIYRKSTLRASTAGFLNWIHMQDSNTAPTNHGTDAVTGKFYNKEITTAINTTFGFVQLFDTAIPDADVFDKTT